MSTRRTPVLTDRQQRLLELLREDERRSIRELMARSGISSTSTVAHNLQRLADYGLIEIGHGRSRSVRVVGRPSPARVIERAKIWRARDPELDRLIREYESQQ